MKHVIDAGLAYVRLLDIKPAKTYSKLESQLKEKISSEVAGEIIQQIKLRGTKEAVDNAAFYDLKNTNLATSLALSGAHDGDIIRKVCNWISDNASMFGQNILEVGCDCGIISCFLARTFPQSRIVAIDRCEKAIFAAKELASQLGVANVEFRHTDAADLPWELFDTVFSMRSMHENMDAVQEDHTLLIGTQGQMFCNALQSYAKILSTLVCPSGNLISIEHCNRDPLLLGWMHALNKAELIPDPDAYHELICREVDNEKSCLQVTVATPGTSIPEDEIHDIFSSTFMGHVNLNAGNFQWANWEAAILLQNSIQDLIEGYFLYTRDGKKYGKLAIWSNKADEESILVEQVFEDDRLVANCHSKTLEDSKSSMKNAIFAAVKRGDVAMPFQYTNGREVESGTKILLK